MKLTAIVSTLAAKNCRPENQNIEKVGNFANFYSLVVPNFDIEISPLSLYIKLFYTLIQYFWTELMPFSVNILKPSTIIFCNICEFYKISSAIILLLSGAPCFDSSSLAFKTH